MSLELLRRFRTRRLCGRGRIVGAHHEATHRQGAWRSGQAKWKRRRAAPGPTADRAIQRSDLELVEPNSTTRLVGRLRKAAAAAALWCREAYSFSRHGAIPAADGWNHDVARKEVAGLHGVEADATEPEQLQRIGHVGNILEAEIR